MSQQISKACPRCGTPTDNLVQVNTALKVALTVTESGKSTPGLVCQNCYNELTGLVSQGMRLRIEHDNREKNKMMLWKNRVNLIKQGRFLMTQKAYSEAAVNYEKYLRVLEMVFNLKKGQLTPEIFNNSKRSKELTVVASVYWDLMRIYDTSPRYGDRMAAAAGKLAAFLPFSTIYPEVTKKADHFLRSARNPTVVKSFLKDCKSAGRSRCFIATAVFLAPQSDEVESLRRFRDQKLRPTWSGRKIIYFYYRCSPPIARWLDNSPRARRALRPALRKIANIAKKSLNSQRNSINS